MFIFKNSNMPIGLDISDSSLKLVQLKKKNNKLSIQALSKINIEKNVLKNGEIKHKQKFLDILKEALSNPKFGNFTTNNVVACLPESKTYIELIEIQKSPNKLEDLIESEIEKYIPYKIDEIFYSWQLIEDKKNSYTILIGAAEKSIINQYTSILCDSGLSILALELESVAICRSLLIDESPKTHIKQFKNYVIIDIGASKTNLIIYSKNTIALSVSLPISGTSITSQIANTLEISEIQAEKAKIICGLDKKIAKGIIKKILSNTLKELNTKIASSLNFFQNEFSNRGQINEIILSGGGSNIKGLDEIISSATSIKTINGNIFTHFNKEFSEKFSKKLIEKHNLKPDNLKISKSTKLSVKQSASSGYATAIGLALREYFITGKTNH